MSGGPTRVLFVSTADAARGIMAEAVLRSIGGDRFEARSAGTHPGPLHPLAVQVLDAAGLDRAGLRSKALDEVLGEPFDYVITLCDDARA
ncbi:MAG TPA: arsenate reductase ArsC, partial [Candidatus Dormibacteraeota bacterium]|nr:arsenate reductase ArsC [Candidatus Dormibacteraeota bacterium]